VRVRNQQLTQLLCCLQQDADGCGFSIRYPIYPDLRPQPWQPRASAKATKVFSGCTCGKPLQFSRSPRVSLVATAVNPTKHLRWLACVGIKQMNQFVRPNS